MENGEHGESRGIVKTARCILVMTSAKQQPLGRIFSMHSPSIRPALMVDGHKKILLSSYRGRSPSKISIFGCHISKIEKNGEQDCSPFGQSLVEINFCSPHFAHFRIASATHYSSSHHHNNQMKEQQQKPQQ